VQDRAEYWSRIPHLALALRGQNAAVCLLDGDQPLSVISAPALGRRSGVRGMVIPLKPVLRLFSVRVASIQWKSHRFWCGGA